MTEERLPPPSQGASGAGGAQTGVCSSVLLFAGCVAGFNLAANASMN